MIKCVRDESTTTIETCGSPMEIAADCCEVISAIYRRMPPIVRDAFKASVLLATTHSSSPMWDLDRRGEGVAFCSDKGELERQIAELQRKGGAEGGGQHDKD